jgi:hypothetical protein
MLKFLENHDEQRIASRFFAGDPWKAIPAMVLAATIDDGPLMIYFGQETGEPAEGVSGFSGDNGRTTIYDYWNVPCHQLWMSNGRFDGSNLPPALAELKSNYTRIFRLLHKYRIFSQPDFYDLMWCNQDLRRISCGRFYSYLRYDDHYMALILLNFAETAYYGMQLSVPRDANIPSASVEATEISVTYFPGNIGGSAIAKNGSEFIFDIPSFSAIIAIIKLPAR